jgi:hypothetical protein
VKVWQELLDLGREFGPVPNRNYAHCVLPNVNRFQVNLVEQSGRGSLFGTTRAAYPVLVTAARTCGLESGEPTEDIS